MIWCHNSPSIYHFAVPDGIFLVNVPLILLIYPYVFANPRMILDYTNDSSVISCSLASNLIFHSCIFCFLNDNLVPRRDSNLLS